MPGNPIHDASVSIAANAALEVVAQVEPQIARAIAAELANQRQQLKLIASEMSIFWCKERFIRTLLNPCQCAGPLRLLKAITTSAVCRKR